MVPGRSAGVPEWLDLIKQEFDSISHEAMVAKAQRDECEHKSKLNVVSFFDILDVFFLFALFVRILRMWTCSKITDLFISNYSTL